MSTFCFIKLCLAAVVLSFVAYYAFPYIGITDGTPAASILATGILAGVILGGLFSTMKLSISGENSGNILYVGNIPFNAREDEVQRLFETYGGVKAVRLVAGGPSKRPKGYGFVEMNSRAEAQSAIALNGTEFGGRKIRVNQAKHKGPQA